MSHEHAMNSSLGDKARCCVKKKKKQKKKCLFDIQLGTSGRQLCAPVWSLEDKVKVKSYNFGFH